MSRNNLPAAVMISLSILFCGPFGYAQAGTGTEFVSFTDDALNQKLVSFVSLKTGVGESCLQVEDTRKLDEGLGSVFLKASVRSDDGTGYTVSGIMVTDDPGSDWQFSLESSE